MTKEEVDSSEDEFTPQALRRASLRSRLDAKSAYRYRIIIALASLADPTGSVAAQLLHETQRNAIEAARQSLAISTGRAERERERDASLKLQLMRDVVRLRQRAHRRGPAEGASELP